MFDIRESRTSALLATLTAPEYAELRDHVESLDRDGGTLYMDAPTLDALPEHALPATVRAAFEAALTSRDALELTVTLADPRLPLDEIPERTSLVLASAGREVDVAGKALVCLVCAGTLFREQRAQLHTAAATFFGVEWTGPTATCCICVRCGYIHWFAD